MINDNADMIDLPEDMRITKKFNITDLHEFCEVVTLYPDYRLRMSSFEEERTDEGQVL